MRLTRNVNKCELDNFPNIKNYYSLYQITACLIVNFKSTNKNKNLLIKQWCKNKKISKTDTKHNCE